MPETCWRLSSDTVEQPRQITISPSRCCRAPSSRRSSRPWRYPVRPRSTQPSAIARGGREAANGWLAALADQTVPAVLRVPSIPASRCGSLMLVWVGSFQARFGHRAEIAAVARGLGILGILHCQGSEIVAAVETVGDHLDLFARIAFVLCLVV